MSICRLTATTRGKTVRFEVRAGQPITLGRSNQCTVPVNDPKMSREHCRLEFVDGKLRVIDLGSSHGLMLRGASVTEFELEIGDGFHAGQTFVRFEAQEADVAPATAQSATPSATPPVTPPVAQPVAPPPDAQDDAEPMEEEPEAPEEPEDQYPNVSDSGRDSRAERNPRRRRRAAKGGGLVVLIVGQICLILTVLITAVAVLLALKHHNPEWDVYRLLDYLRPPK